MLSQDPGVACLEMLSGHVRVNLTTWMLSAYIYRRNCVSVNNDIRLRFMTQLNPLTIIRNP